jgi:hypothetical protein
MYEITLYSPYLLTYFQDFSVYLISETYVPNCAFQEISVTLGMHLT